MTADAKTNAQGKEDLDEDDEWGKKYVITEMDAVIKHHEDKRIAAIRKSKSRTLPMPKEIFRGESISW